MVSVPLHRMAITYRMSWPSSQACSHLACPQVSSAVNHANGTPAVTARAIIA